VRFAVPSQFIAAAVLQVFEGMGLASITGRDVQINACSATTGDGLREGLEWCIKKFEAKGGGGGGGGK
jgi:hypothetical protein